MMKKTIRILLVTLLILIAFGTAVLAQSGYLLTSNVVAGGGGSLQAGSYSLTGTIGQPEAGHDFAAGAYTFHGGFWYLGPSDSQKVLIPIVIR
jgi:hypothetical protein